MLQRAGAPKWPRVRGWREGGQGRPQAARRGSLEGPVSRADRMVREARRASSLRLVVAWWCSSGG
jgi:hypothetical protein